MMMRSFLVCVAVLASLPSIAFGQSRSAPQKDVPCCGQAETETESVEKMILNTQENLQSLLMMRMNTMRIPAGDHFITESAEGFAFRAFVSRKGIVESWYFEDTEGMPVALINASGNNGPSGGGGGAVQCLVKYSQDVSNCAYLEQGWPNRYKLCLDNAWSQLISCLRRITGRGNGTVIW